MDTKNVFFKHCEKVFLVMALCYLVYTFVNIFIFVRREANKIDAQLLAQSSIVERRIKTSTPPASGGELMDAARLESRFISPPVAVLLQRPQVFGKIISRGAAPEVTTKDLLKRIEPQTLARLEIAAPGDTEFVYKGGTADLALIQVRKLRKDAWQSECFTVQKGGSIGQKIKTGKETLDFDTHCKLIEIVPAAQKPMSIKTTTVVKTDKGDFLGTAPSEEIHMITSSRIVFETKKGESYNLWLGELINLGTETVTVQPVKPASPTN